MGYIWNLCFSNVNNIELSESTFITLCEFAKHKELSTNQLKENLNSTNYKISYKNILKKVKRFKSQKLIEKSKTRKFGTYEIYYKITTIGIFYVLYTLIEKSLDTHQQIEIINNMLINNKDDEFFNIFLYPYFEVNTILKIKSYSILRNLLQYCQECSLKLLFKVIYIDLFNQKRDRLVRWSKLCHDNKNSLPTDDIILWLLDIKQKYNFIWLDNNIKIHVIDEKTIIIYHGENELYLKINKHDKTATLKYNNKIIKKFDIFLDEDDVIFYNQDQIEKLRHTIDIIYLDLTMDREDILVKTVIFPFIIKGKYKNYDVNNWKEIEEDVILMVNDKKFYKILQRTHNSLNNCYKNIIEYKTFL